MIFVFGSNEAGIHGAGAAKHAYEKLGAQWGVGFGPTGKCFAIPTKSKAIRTLSIKAVEGYVANFICYAEANPELKFQVTQIGCGLAGFTAKEISPLFKDAPKNCLFDTAWASFLPEKPTWGTF